MLSFPAPDVLLNVSATVISNSSIKLTWAITDVHPQLKVKGFNIKYCVLKRNGTSMEDLDKTCTSDPCEEKNENANAVPYLHMMDSQKFLSLHHLRSYTKYGITVRATNITARDGTVVKTPYGNYSEPVYNTTHEGGKRTLLSTVKSVQL